jgi:DUF3047 family protein
LLLALGALLLSPRYRRFYFGFEGRAGEQTSRGESARAAGASAAPRAQTFGFPLPIGGARAALPPEAPVGRRGLVRVPEPDAEGRIRVAVTDVVPARLPSSGPPVGWNLQEFAGHANVQLVLDDGRVAVDLRSDRASFALYRDVVLDPKRYPRLRWSWKALRLPPDGDARYRATDDEVAQIYIVFPRWPAPRVNSDVLGYVWDTRAPVETAVMSPQASNVRSIVVESGPQRVGFWIQEERDVYADFVALFGREPGRVGKVAIMTDSNDTLSQSEVLVGDLIFFRPVPRNAKIGSVYAKMPPMLRNGS